MSFLKKFATQEKKAGELGTTLGREFRENVGRVSKTIEKLRAAGREMEDKQVGGALSRLADEMHNAVVDILVVVRELEQY